MVHHFGERYRAEFPPRILKRVQPSNFANPNSSVAPASIGSFGKIFSTIGDPREIQFALKFYF